MNTKSITIPASQIQSVVIYADGACPNNGKPNSRMYCSFAVYVNEKLVHTQKVDLSELAVKQTNNTAEFHALIEALSYMTQAQRKRLEFVVRTDSELVYDFWQAFSANALCNLHITVPYGRNSHHMAEAIFKAAARALRMAFEPDPRIPDVPSTKGTL